MEETASYTSTRGWELIFLRPRRSERLEAKTSAEHIRHVYRLVFAQRHCGVYQRHDESITGAAGVSPRQTIRKFKGEFPGVRMPHDGEQVRHPPARDDAVSVPLHYVPLPRQRQLARNDTSHPPTRRPDESRVVTPRVLVHLPRRGDRPDVDLPPPLQPISRRHRLLHGQLDAEDFAVFPHER